MDSKVSVKVLRECSTQFREHKSGWKGYEVVKRSEHPMKSKMLSILENSIHWYCYQHKKKKKVVPVPHLLVPVPAMANREYTFGTGTTLTGTGTAVCE